MTIPPMIVCSSILNKSMNHVDSPTEVILFRNINFVMIAVELILMFLQLMRIHPKFTQPVDSVQDHP